MAYPSALDSYTTKIDAVHDVMAVDVNGLQTAVVNIETALGTNPQGSAADVKTRLAQSMAATGNLQFATATVLTISGGVITATQNWHIVTTEAAATTDDLDTITAIYDGFALFLHTPADNRQVRIRHNAGNIYCINGQDIYLNRAGDLCILVQDSALGKWLAIASKTLVMIVTAATTYAATSNNDVILCDATAGAFSVSLPAVATSIGMVVTIKKIDASANAITIDPNASETIDGVTTKQLTAQWNALTVACNGVAWFVC